MPVLMFIFLCVNCSLKANPQRFIQDRFMAALMHLKSYFFKCNIFYGVEETGKSTDEAMQATHDAVGPPADS